MEMVAERIHVLIVVEILMVMVSVMHKIIVTLPLIQTKRIMMVTVLEMYVMIHQTVAELVVQ